MAKIEKIDEKDKTVTVTLDLNEVKMLHCWRCACEEHLEKRGDCILAVLRFFGCERKDICASLIEFITEVLTKLDKELDKELKKEREKKKEEKCPISLYMR